MPRRSRYLDEITRLFEDSTPITEGRIRSARARGEGPDDYTRLFGLTIHIRFESLSV